MGWRLRRIQSGVALRFPPQSKTLARVPEAAKGDAARPRARENPYGLLFTAA